MERLVRNVPVAGAIVGALIFGVLRPLRDDFDGGFVEVLEWAALGAVIWGAATAVISSFRSRAGTGEMSPTSAAVRSGLLGLAVLLITFLALREATEVDRLASTVRVVFIAVTIVGGIWIGANGLAGLARKNWTLFVFVAASIVSAGFFAVLRGNQVISSLVAGDDPTTFPPVATGFWGGVEWPIYGVVVLGGAAAVMTLLPRIPKIAVGVGAGAVTGFLIAENLQLAQRPDFDWVTTIVFTLIGAGLFAIRPVGGTRLHPKLLTGAAIGFIVGAWLLSDWHLFSFGLDDARIAAIVPFVLLGARLGFADQPTAGELGRSDNRARAVIFLGPALGFLSAALVIPAIGTIWLSFQDRDSEEFVGLENYRTIFSDEASFNVSDWSSMFGSRLFWYGAALIITGVIIGFVSGQRRNNVRSFERVGSSITSLSFGLILVAFAALSVLRGTFFNNVWWVITVVSASTALGLAIAVLAERAGKLENFVKSLIFMPMAISFVGASIVWRLQYQPRDPRSEQTGVLNAFWVGLGKLSRAGEAGNTYPGWTRWLVLLLLAAALAAIIRAVIPKIKAAESFTVHVAGIIVFGYLFVQLLLRSLGGFEITADGTVRPDTVLFLQNPPFNNIFLMIILIWIQTGFAMVILSAAIRSVPQEFLEAARVDGANESQIFFQVILPQILPTIGVVVTTLIVLVTKVFDIVKVTTGGNFGTNVLANDMFQVSFSFFNRGLGSAIAVLILISVLPVIYLNIRRMQEARAV